VPPPRNGVELVLLANGTVVALLVRPVNVWSPMPKVVPLISKVAVAR
jgi:hypothetical protein